MRLNYAAIRIKSFTGEKMKFIFSLTSFIAFLSYIGQILSDPQHTIRWKPIAWCHLQRQQNPNHVFISIWNGVNVKISLDIIGVCSKALQLQWPKGKHKEKMSDGSDCDDTSKKSEERKKERNKIHRVTHFDEAMASYHLHTNNNNSVWGALTSIGWRGKS